MRTTAALLNIDFETYVKIAKKQINLIYQSPNTIYKNFVESSKLLHVNENKLKDAFVKRPQLFIQKPETIYENVTKLANLLGISEKCCINVCLRNPQLFTQKPETIHNNAKRLALLSNTSMPELIKSWIMQPTLFTYKSDLIAKKQKINDYFSLIKEKDSQKKTIEILKDEELYSKILKYLINKSGKATVPYSRNTYKTVQDYITANPDIEYLFEIPNHNCREEFVQFVENMSKNLIGKNIFHFKVIDKNVV